jgi:RNA polymerase sigma-70 factor, ECF subfamily
VDADPRTDRDLVCALALGDRHALATLYARHAAWLVLRLSRRCSDSGAVDEAVQDTFLAAWRGADRFAAKGEVAAWLWGIASRRLADQLRRRSPTEVPLTDVIAGAPSAEEQVLRRVEFGRLGTALAKIAPELRAVVQATVLDGLTSDEAAQLLGIPTGTVKTRLMRARAALRRELT